MKATDTNDFFNSLNAGVFSQQIGRALSDVAAGVVDHSKQGEDSTLDTPLYVTESGLTLFQNDPTAQLFNRTDTPVKARAV